MRELGRGQWSSVNLVTDPETKKQAARKMVSGFSRQIDIDYAISIAWNEADILSFTTSKKIPGIIKLLGVEAAKTKHGHFYPALLLEPFLEEDGWAKWDRATFLEPSSTALVVTQLIQTVRALEMNKIWLRDFKPDNLFVRFTSTSDTRPEIKIYDLGSASNRPTSEGRDLCKALWNGSVLARALPGKNLPSFEEVWEN